MNTEIELKYLVSDTDAEQKITSFLDLHNISYQHHVKSLGNSYFDTPDQALRKLDIGLRIRTCNNFHEQTIKTAGVVIGGLHQRPEYNVNVDLPYPQLSLFPDSIWPKRQSIDELQNNLISLFNTNFKRVTWLIADENGNVIELAFDQGTISTGGKEEQVCEIELELVKGHRDVLFNLAKALFAQLNVRPGVKSKAARGYALWQESNTLPSLTLFELVPLKGAGTISQVFTAGLSFGLNQLQSMINAYVEQPSLSYLAKLVENLALLRHGFWLFEKHLPESSQEIRAELSYFMQLFQWVDGAVFIKELTDKTGNYRKKIEFSEQLFEQLNIEKRRFPETEHVISLIYSSRFNKLQLALLQLLLAMKPTTKEQSENLLNFANNCLDTSLANVFSNYVENDDLTIEQYLTEQKLVIRSLLTGSWFGDLFDKTQRLTFRSPWLDIKHGLSELQTLSVLQKQLQMLDEPPKKLVNWHHDKVSGLLMALNHSRRSALSLQPYWRNL